MADETTAQTGTGDTTAPEKIDAATTTTTDTKDTGATTTLAGGKDGGAVATEIKPATTADTDWRAAMAGEDKDFRKRLDRFASPPDFAKSYRALEQKLSSGEVKKALPENPTADDIAAYRKENGIPDKPEAYDVKLGNGIVPGEADKPVIELFKQFAHAKNLPPAALNDTLTWYYETQDAIASQKADQDETFRLKAEDDLRAEMGADYRRNMNVLGALRDSMPDTLSDRLLAGRTADGQIIGNDPAMVKWLVSLGLDLNPAATIIPSGQGEPGKNVDARLNEIRDFRRGNPDKYDSDKAMQQEERDLLDVQAKLNARKAA